MSGNRALALTAILVIVAVGSAYIAGWHWSAGNKTTLALNALNAVFSVVLILIARSKIRA